ncbi:hypothetical protein M8C21_021191, partial [Ambrosia artemisiifolia]
NVEKDGIRDEDLVVGLTTWDHVDFGFEICYHDPAVKKFRFTLNGPRTLEFSAISYQILHYLGLDHVGHLGGRSSVMMRPKLQKTDEVIKLIHLSTIQSQESDHRPTLLVVVSDHGMQENGNHGGSSYEETNSLALFIGTGINHVSSTYDTINQVAIGCFLFCFPFIISFLCYVSHEGRTSKANISILPIYEFKVPNGDMEQHDVRACKMTPMETNGPDFSTERAFQIED